MSATDPDASMSASLGRNTAAALEAAFAGAASVEPLAGRPTPRRERDIKGRQHVHTHGRSGGNTAFSASRQREQPVSRSEAAFRSRPLTLSATLAGQNLRFGPPLAGPSP